MKYPLVCRSELNKSYKNKTETLHTFSIHYKNNSMSHIKIEGLYKIFGRKTSEALNAAKNGLSKKEILEKYKAVLGVNNVNLEIKKGEIFVIMGLSGCGKSTLIRCFNKLIPATAGSVKIDGTDLSKASNEELRDIRRNKMAMVFQHFGLLPHRNVISNVAYGLELQNVAKEERESAAMEVLQQVGLEPYAENMVSELSGGMQQQVGLARALCNDPDILLMDEAFSALDPLIRAQMQDELLELQVKLHKTIVFITHDLDEALKLGDRIAILKDGAVMQIDTPEGILTNPANDYVESFIENVDRTKVLTASAIMKKPETVSVHKDGPHQALRIMKKINVSKIPVLDKERNYLGVVFLDEVLKEVKKESRDLKDIIVKDAPVADLDTPLMELAAIAVDSVTIPIAVLDEQKKFRGLITRTMILSSLSGKEEEADELAS